MTGRTVRGGLPGTAAAEQTSYTRWEERWMVDEVALSWWWWWFVVVALQEACSCASVLLPKND